MVIIKKIDKNMRKKKKFDIIKKCTVIFQGNSCCIIYDISTIGHCCYNKELNHEYRYDWWPLDTVPHNMFYPPNQFAGRSIPIKNQQQHWSSAPGAHITCAPKGEIREKVVRTGKIIWFQRENSVDEVLEFRLYSLFFLLATIPTVSILWLRDKAYIL